MRSNSKTAGDYAELRTATYFASRGFYVSRPLSDNAPYDMVVDVSGRLFKVQVKSRRKLRGAVRVELISANDRYRRPYLPSDFDILAVHYIDEDRLAFLTWDVISQVKNNLRLRVDPTLNNMSEGIRQFEDFEDLDVSKLLRPQCSWVGSGLMPEELQN